MVGSISRDTIQTHKKDIIKKYGCVTHPTIALAKLMKNEGVVYPISNIHKVDENNIKNLFNTYPAISLKGISSEENSGTVIFLDFVHQNNRKKKQTFMLPVLPTHVEDF